MHIVRFPFLLIFVISALLCLFLAPTAYAQITITSTDIEKIVDRGLYGYSNLVAAPGEAARIQAVLDQVGPGSTFDFGNVEVTADFTEAETQKPPFGPEVPSDPAFSEADYVSVVSVFGSEPTYSFSGLNGPSEDGSDGLYELGSVTEGVSTTTIEPPLRRLPLPATYGTTWSSEESDVTESSDLSAFTNTYTRSFTGEFVGYGTLIVPGSGQVEALAHRLVTVEDGETVRAFEFFGKDRLLSAFALVDENDKVLTYPLPDGTMQPAAFFQIGTEEAIREQIASNTTGPFLEGLPGTSGTLTDGSDTDGTLRGYYVEHPSSNDAIDDSGTPAGFPVVKVSPEGYWVVRAEGLSGFAYTLCLDYSDLSGVSDPSQLAVLKREDAGSEWIPQPSTLDAGEQQICANGLTSFSEFAIGSGEANPLPVELTAFAGHYDASAEAVRLRWQTTAETNNAGFVLERKVEEGGWSDLSFIEGVGTTSEARSYRFVDRELPFTAASLTYRLRQVDLDGTATWSPPVTLSLGVPDAARLHGVFPNPVRHQATIRYELPRAAEVRLEMYDLLGRRVRSVNQNRAPAGRTEVQFDTSGLPSGVYFVRLWAEDTVHTERVTVAQ